MPKMPRKSKHPRVETNHGAHPGETTGNKGRGAEDRIYRLRAQVWLSGVRTLKKVPLELAAMDRFFLADLEGDGRAFWRVAQEGRDPGIPRNAWGGRSLVDVVSARPGLVHTADVYRSQLWEDVLGTRTVVPKRREALIAETFARLGLFEPTPGDLMAQQILGLDIEGLKPLSRTVLRQRLGLLARTRSVHAILLLCLLYRRAIEEGRFYEIPLIANATLAAIARFCTRVGVLGNVKTVWTFIVRRRVFAGQSSLEHSPQIRALAESIVATLIEGDVARGSYKNASFQHRVWLLGCALDNQADVSLPTTFHPLTAPLEDYMAHRDARYNDAIKRAAGRAVEQIQRAESKRIPAECVVAELPGHLGVVPPEWC